ncbi:hypothetical protein T484DRAFT_1921317 [Baffinella frigidus]|nr:hypothetical protein T484DRAFT_1921317 [Cryptophyta sp. CCMP2293]
MAANRGGMPPPVEVRRPSTMARIRAMAKIHVRQEARIRAIAKSHVRQEIAARLHMPGARPPPNPALAPPPEAGGSGEDSLLKRGSEIAARLHMPGTRSTPNPALAPPPEAAGDSPQDGEGGEGGEGGDSGGGDDSPSEWIHVNVAPAPSPPVEEMDPGGAGGVTRDWQLILEVYREEYVSQIGALVAASRQDMVPEKASNAQQHLKAVLGKVGGKGGFARDAAAHRDAVEAQVQQRQEMKMAIAAAQDSGA